MSREGKFTVGDAFEADVRDNSVGAESQDPGNFPFEAFEFDDPGKNANPEIRVKDPWVLKLSFDNFSEELRAQGSYVAAREVPGNTDDVDYWFWLLGEWGSNKVDVMGTILGHRSSGLDFIRKVDFGFSSSSDGPEDHYQAYVDYLYGENNKDEEWGIARVTYDGTDYVALYRTGSSQHWHSAVYFTGHLFNTPGVDEVFSEVLTSDDASFESEVSYNTEKHFKGKSLTPTMILEDRKSPGTDGGTNSTSRDTRDLNTEVYNDISGASLDSSTGEFTLPAGTYEVEWWSPFYSTQRATTWLYNKTADEDISQSPSTFADVGVYAIGVTPPFELNAESVLRIDYNTQTTNSGHGLGLNQNSDNAVDHELYTRVRVRKVG